MNWFFKPKQPKSAESHIGGKVNLPAHLSIPQCRLCGNKLTFYFKISLTHRPEFQGKSLLMFACTHCADRDRLIPVIDPKNSKHVSSKFMEAYQENFRAILVEKVAAAASPPSNEITSPIQFIPLDLTPTGELKAEGKVFATVKAPPTWINADQSPLTCDGEHPFHFLLQLSQNWEYKIINGAPEQIVVDIMGQPTERGVKEYELFFGSRVYFFGTVAHGGMVYVVTQAR